jgi:ABC-type multidrug transport system fused ATPase/permease subunit
MNRFSKDIDTIDNKLAGTTSFTWPGRDIRSDLSFADSFRTFLNTVSSITGAIILISILFPYFLIAVGVVLVLYALAATFYRASARETKVRASQILGFDMFTERRSQRLDAILRSSLYSHFSESLSGIATIRAYREEGRFLKENRDWVDIENRAYWLTVTNQVRGFPSFIDLRKLSAKP